MKFFLYLILFYLAFLARPALAFKEDIDVQDFQGIVNNLAGWLALIAGLTAVGGIIYAGMALVSTGANPEKIRRAKKIFWWSLGGGVIIVFAYGIFNLIQTLLSGSSALPTPSL